MDDVSLVVIDKISRTLLLEYSKTPLKQGWDTCKFTGRVGCERQDQNDLGPIRFRNTRIRKKVAIEVPILEREYP